MLPMVAPASTLTPRAAPGAAVGLGAATLAELVASEDPVRRAEAARSPALEFELLCQLFSDGSSEVRTALLTRRDLTEQELYPLAFNPKLPSLAARSLAPLLDHPRTEVRQMLALHGQDLPLPMWSRLAGDAEAVRVAMAENESLPDFALAWLADWPCASTRVAVAQRDDLPEWMQQHLAQDPDPLVRDAIAMNPAVVSRTTAPRSRR